MEELSASISINLDEAEDSGMKAPPKRWYGHVSLRGVISQTDDGNIHYYSYVKFSAAVIFNFRRLFTYSWDVMGQGGPLFS